MNRGAVVVGYPGIGKTSLSEKNIHCLDLESSIFTNVWGYSNLWQVVYGKTAVSLAQQGYVVFVSSHQSVYRYLNSIEMPNGVFLMGCHPSPALKDEWLDRLRVRAETTQNDKDIRAFEHAWEYFDQDIQDMHSGMKNKLEIAKMDYSLLNLLQWMFSAYNTGIYI